MNSNSQSDAEKRRNAPIAGYDTGANKNCKNKHCDRLALPKNYGFCELHRSLKSKGVPIMLPTNKTINSLKKTVVLAPVHHPLPFQVSSQPQIESAQPTIVPHTLQIHLGNVCNILAHRQISLSEQQRRRKAIHQSIIHKLNGVEPMPTNFEKVLTTDIMIHMLHEYDQLFFSQMLLRLCAENQCQFDICWNNRCVTTAGFMRTTCRTGGCHTIQIDLSPKVFRKAMKHVSFENGVSQGAVKCYNTLECLQLTFEHELVHAFIRCLCDKESTNRNGEGVWSGKVQPSTGHGRVFMSILNNTFGHTEFTHNLFVDENTEKQIKHAKQLHLETDKQDFVVPPISTTESISNLFKINDRVEFTSKNVLYKGILINKNDTEGKGTVIIPTQHNKEMNVPYTMLRIRIKDDNITIV